MMMQSCTMHDPIPSFGQTATMPEGPQQYQGELAQNSDFPHSARTAHGAPPKGPACAAEPYRIQVRCRCQAILFGEPCHVTSTGEHLQRRMDFSRISGGCKHKFSQKLKFCPLSLLQFVFVILYGGLCRRRRHSHWHLPP